MHSKKHLKVARKNMNWVCLLYKRALGRRENKKCVFNPSWKCYGTSVYLTEVRGCQFPMQRSYSVFYVGSL